MGGAAGKDFQNEKANHAVAVLNAVQSFEETNPVDNDNQQDGNPEFFKQRVLLAAADAKKRGNDIETSLAQLTDADIETLHHYVENQKEEANRSAVMKIEEIIDEEVNNNPADNIDETTSVLSYGDDEEIADNESVGDSTELLKPNLITANKDGNYSSGDEIDEDIELRTKSRESSTRRGSGFKVFPTPPHSAAHHAPHLDTKSAITNSHSNLGIALTANNLKNGLKTPQKPTVDQLISLVEEKLSEDNKLKSLEGTPVSGGARGSAIKAKQQQVLPDPSIGLGLAIPSLADKYAKIWDMDSDVATSLTSQHSLVFDSPTISALKRLNSPIGHTATTPGKNLQQQQYLKDSGIKPKYLYKDMGERIDDRNEALMGLQRQKVISFTQNAQLEREVEALQRQLEKMDQIDREQNKSNNSSTSLNSTNFSTLSNVYTQNISMATNGSSYTVSPATNSTNKHSYASNHHNGGYGNNKSNVPQPYYQQSKYQSIYPIDEESLSNRNIRRNFSNDIAESKQSNSRFDNSTAADFKSNYRNRQMAAKLETDSSSDTDNPTGSRVNISNHNKVNVTEKGAVAQDKRPRGQASNRSESKANHNLPANYSSSSRDEAQSEYVPSIGLANQHAPSNKPRNVGANKRRTRMSGGGGGGNSSGFDSDDSGHHYSLPVHKPSLPTVSDNAAVTEWSTKEKASYPKRREIATNNKREDKEIPPPTVSPQNKNKTAFEEVENNIYNGSLSSRNNIVDSESVKVVGSSAIKASAVKKSHRRRYSLDGHDEQQSSHQQTPTHLTPTAASAGKNKLEETPPTAEGSGSKPRGVQNKLARRRERATVESDGRHGGNVKSSFSTHNNVNEEETIGRIQESAISAAAAIVAEEVHEVSNGHERHPSMELEAPIIIAEESVMSNAAVAGGGGVSVSAQEALSKVKEKKRRARLVKSNSIENAVDENIVEVTPAPPTLSSMWNQNLDNSWAEVGLLLRKPIKSEQDMFYTVAAAEAGIIFTDQMSLVSKNINVLRGALSQWLLPFDNNTRLDGQASTPHSVVENMPEEFRGKLTERQVHYLVAGANGVRRLVRIKIADDNDLEQARSALVTTDKFFKLLYHVAANNNVTPYQLLEANMY